MEVNTLAGLPSFLGYFLTGIALLLLFSFVYTQVTPHNELPLIKKGNNAAAIAFTGALLGYTLPLAAAIAHSINYRDMLAWAGVALAVQIGVLGAMRFTVPALFRDIEKGKTAPAVLHAGISLAAGILNAAAMTY
jgi:putative membrane protein